MQNSDNKSTNVQRREPSGPIHERFTQRTPEWYDILEFNVPLNTAFRRRRALSSDVHLSFSNGGPAT